MGILHSGAWYFLRCNILQSARKSREQEIDTAQPPAITNDDPSAVNPPSSQWLLDTTGSIEIGSLDRTTAPPHQKVELLPIVYLAIAGVIGTVRD